MTKYHGKNIIAIAQERGSRAKTKTGAWKFLMKNLGQPHRGLSMIGHMRDQYEDQVHLGPGSSFFIRDNWRQARMEKRADGRARILGYDPDDPNTPGRILERAYTDHREWLNRARQKLYRDSYGQLCASTPAYYVYYVDQPPRATLANYRAVAPFFSGQDLVNDAAEQGLIDGSYDSIEFDRKSRADGEALHHEIYDASPSGSEVLLCLRKTEGTRYGVKTLSKNYVIITRRENGEITVTPAKKSIAAKAAKQAGLRLGEAIEILKGNGKLPAPPLPGNGICYKKVAIDERGRLVSVYDGSPWLLGQTRHDPARREHNGGLYVYETLDEARVAPFPDDSVFADADKCIVKCRVSGIYARYDNKMAFSTVTPLTVVEICN